ncbi:unnamed protein product [Brassica rapa]|uniref:Uncharacterized protein n=1 Tax=Brassica campestris TaxID=3711 RepID=A0A8D9G5F1_BRACM|nr:unnamed protein product [Brassica rapa]
MQRSSYLKIRLLGNRAIWKQARCLLFLKLFEINGDRTQFFHRRKATYRPLAFLELVRDRSNSARCAARSLLFCSRPLIKVYRPCKRYLFHRLERDIGFAVPVETSASWALNRDLGLIFYHLIETSFTSE